MTITRSKRGSVYIETLVCFLPLFFMVLVMAQQAFLYAAMLVVEHAATRGARAAMVVLDDDPQHYDGRPRLDMEPPGASGSGFLPDMGLGTAKPLASGPRYLPVRMAVYSPLLPIAPTYEQLMTSRQRLTVRRAIGKAGMSRLGTAIGYDMGAGAVTFPSRRGSSRYRHDFRNSDTVTVRVTYLFHCAVPFASRFMCDSIWELESGFPIRATQGAFRRAREGSLRPQDIAALSRGVDHQRARLDASKRGYAELQKAEEPWLRFVFGARGGRFRVITGEATMPIQKAPYLYESELQASNPSGGGGAP